MDYEMENMNNFPCQMLSELNLMEISHANAKNDKQKQQQQP